MVYVYISFWNKALQIYIFIYILYTFFSCCTFKSHASLETVLSAFILNHMTKRPKKKKKKSIQYSGSMLHSFNFGILNIIFFVNQLSITLCVWKMETVRKSVVLKIHIIYPKPFGDAIYGRCCTSYLSYHERWAKRDETWKGLTTNVVLKAAESKPSEDVFTGKNKKV